MKLPHLFLLIISLGLLPIAFSYGLFPQKSLEYFYNISIDQINTTHFFRAVMGLYLAFACFWFMAAFKSTLTKTALYSVVVFMLGLASGRALSFVIDGMPSLVFLGYFVGELSLSAFSLYLLKKI